LTSPRSRNSKFRDHTRTVPGASAGFTVTNA
jgi:hypothetical protein